ncbi:MAG: UDP-N-acetylglucosamine 2-epimerase (non-hydrolyzing), partial [Patescibacteria group bacterium]
FPFPILSPHLLSVASARPNFVKLAAIVHAFPKDWTHTIVHTGQHYDPMLSDVFFQELKIPDPAENLGVKGGVTNEETIENTRKACIPVLQKYKPNLVIVYGDVAGGLGGAQAAHELGIPIAHVEAGLRSFDQEMPEERNRIAIDQIASLLFVSEQAGIENLKKEGMTKGVHLVGNTMIDTLLRMRSVAERYKLPMFPITLSEKFGVVTLHRPSNVDRREDFERNVHFLNEVVEVCPLIFPTHLRTRAAFVGGFHAPRPPLKSLSSRVHHTAPLGYLAFLKLLSLTTFILTDSGGIQEEATFLQKKCFTLRKNTERPSTIESGSNTLIDLEKESDRALVLDYAAHPAPPVVAVPPLWDGNAGKRIVGVLQSHFG